MMGETQAMDHAFGGHLLDVKSGKIEIRWCKPDTLTLVLPESIRLYGVAVNYGQRHRSRGKQLNRRIPAASNTPQVRKPSRAAFDIFIDCSYGGNGLVSLCVLQ
jgi:hypothetical protein